MGKVENLVSQAATKKLKALVEDVNMAMFCTNLGAKPFGATPMATQGVDDDGTIWFFSVKDSDRNKDLEQDSAVQLIYSSPSGLEYLSVYGQASIVQDQEKVKELWSAPAKIWFQEGPDDPRLTLVKFVPDSGYYWDTQHGKVVAMAKMAASLVTGKTMDDSVDGKLHL